MDQQNKKKAVIYCRVSTKEQAEEGNSLVTQEKNCQEYAIKNGYEIVAVFIEQGESAKTADRTELKKLMSFCAIKKNEINAIIAYKIDRISRNTDDYSQIRILLKRYGVEIKSTSEYFEDTPAGRFMENIIANVAQFDNDVRAERCTGGMKDAVREGRYVWLAPYGYSNVKVNGKSTIEPNQFAPVVRKVFETVARDIQPIEVTRRELASTDLINKSGEPVSKSYFYQILRNRVYTGWIDKFGESNKGKYEPIISEGLFQQVQNVLAGKNKKKVSYNYRASDFPLRRFTRHPSGIMFTGCWSKGKNKLYPYYLVHKFKIIIRKEVLEESFKNLLNQFRLDIDYFEKLLSFVKINIDKGIKERMIDFDSLRIKLEELKSKQEVLAEKNITGVIADDVYKKLSSKIQQEIWELENIINTTNEKPVVYFRLVEKIREILLSPGDIWEKADFETKIRLQWFYFPHGIEFDGLNIQTPEVCNLFNAKNQFLTAMSSVVDHQNNKSNTDNMQITLYPKRSTDTANSNSISDEVFLSTLREEIVYLANLNEESYCAPSHHKVLLDTYLK